MPPMLQRAHGRHSMQCATHNVSHATRPLARSLPPRAGPVKSGLGPARRCVACHDALLVRVARATVVCVACRLSQVICCRCADTASAHESTPQQPPAARRYSRRRRSCGQMRRGNVAQCNVHAGSGGTGELLGETMARRKRERIAAWRVKRSSKITRKSIACA